MRTFIAIGLPKDIQDKLAILQGRLKKSGADVKWVEPKNIHLTLKFLGEIDEDQQPKIINILEEALKNKKPFSIRISSCGAFPKISSPRVIWVGLDQGGRETETLTQELEEKIAQIGIPKEGRVFSSHITIGRVKSASNREKLVQSLNTLGPREYFGGLEFTADRITLFKSTLTPAGPVYEALREINLAIT